MVSLSPSPEASEDEYDNGDSDDNDDGEDKDASSSGDDCLSYLPFVIHDKKEEVVLV